MRSSHLVGIEVVLHDLKNRARSLVDRASSGADVAAEVRVLARDVVMLYDDARAYACAVCAAGLLGTCFQRAMEREIAPTATLAGTLAAGGAWTPREVALLRDALMEQHEGRTQRDDPQARREPSAISTALSGAVFVGAYHDGVSPLRRAIRHVVDTLVGGDARSIGPQVLLGDADGSRVLLKIRKSGSRRDVPLGIWLYLGADPLCGRGGQALVV